MSHVDEGTLHAYLDGELSSNERGSLENHLASCVACRERLGDERALLQRASSLLGAARPAERPIPAFEQVRRAPKRAPWFVSTRLAWAASVVFAVGLGYYLRGGDPEPHAVLRMPAAVAPDSATTVATLQADKVTEPARPPAARREKEGNAAPAASGARLDPAPVDVAVQQPALQLRDAGLAARQREADSVAAAQRAALTLSEAVVVAPAPSAQSGVVTGKVSSVEEQAQSRSMRNRVATTWPLISQGTATSMLGERPVGVPGLATRRIRRSPGPDSTVVVEQALDSTTVIQIFQRPATTDGFGAERGQADRVLARYVGRLRVEISGPVSTDSLNKLLEQVEPIP